MLDAAYGEATRKARLAVAAEYPLEDVPEDDPDFPKGTSWRELWRIGVEVEGQVRMILCGIPPTFPDRFPAIYLHAVDMEEWGELPHVDNRRFLCTFDTDSVQINADQPAELVLAVITKAVSILEDGINGRNVGDYADELGAYWEKAASGKALSLLKDGGSSRVVSRLRLRQKFRGYSSLFAETKEEGERWLANVGHGKRGVRAEDALYLPLVSLGIPPFPATNAELSDALSVAGGDALDLLHGFLSGRPRPSAVLASVEATGGSVMLAWEHPLYYHTVRTESGYRTIVGGVPGFRNGQCPPRKELTQFNGSGSLLHMNVERVDSSRLFRRTVGARLAPLEKEVAVIGCGSLGGFVADSLIRAGITEKLALVDPQVLRPENVWRHYCGMNGVGMHKAKAVSAALRAHFPHVTVNTFEASILDLLADGEKPLKSASLIVHTVGAFAVDRRMNDLFQEGALGDGPLCLMWVEPGLVAGHALLLFPGQAGCFECQLDKETLLYVERAITNPGGLGMREPGCQSSYQPYGAVDLTAFVSGAARFLAKHKESGTNMRYTWYGDLEAARANGITLNGRLERAQSFSEETAPIKSLQGCPICQAK